METKESQKTKNYLFVCAANINRSPAAEKICNEIAKQNKLAIEASSAGLSLFSSFSGQKLTTIAKDINISPQLIKSVKLNNHLFSNYLLFSDGTSNLIY